MLGHILRSDQDTPAFKSLTFAMSNELRSRKGRHQMNLMHVIKSDLKCRNFGLQCVDDIYDLCEIASDRARWRSALHGDLLKTQAGS